MSSHVFGELSSPSGTITTGESPIPLDPFHISASQWVARGVYVIAKLGIADLLHDNPMTVEQIASASNTNQSVLTRIMQSLAVSGFFSVNEHKQFTLNRYSEQLRTDADVSFRYWTIVLGETWWRASGEILQATMDGSNAFEAAYGKTMWDYYADHPDDQELFDRAMNEVTEWQSRHVVAKLPLESAQCVCDVASGRGALISAVLKKHANVTGIAFDRPTTVPGLKESLEKRGLAERCEVVGGDFFKEVPSDADLYLLKHTLHDWDDEHAVGILRTCHKAMRADSRMCIVEGLKPENDADALLDWLDIEQLIVTASGCERTLSDFDRLLKESGFRRTGLHATNVRDASLILAEKIPT